MSASHAQTVAGIVTKPMHFSTASKHQKFEQVVTGKIVGIKRFEPLGLSKVGFSSQTVTTLR